MSVQVSYKKQGTLGIIGLIIIFLVIETIANFWWIAQIECEFEQNEIFVDLSEDRQREMCVELYDIRTLGDELIPNQKTESITINSLGFRGNELPTEKSESEFRIFMIGGSTMFGYGATSDETTIPGFMDNLFKNNNLDTIRVINAGIQGADSFDELRLIQTKILELEPDLVIIYDGWNDLRENNTPDQISRNWNSMCRLGQENGFDTTIALQPIAGFGNKKLTEQETGYVKNGVDYNNEKLSKSLDVYNEYERELDFLTECSLSINLRDSFDDEDGSIYWDQGHISDKGNEIVANSIFKNIFSLVPTEISTNTEAFSVEDAYTENNNDIEKIRYILAGYKTPLMLGSFFEFRDNFIFDDNSNAEEIIPRYLETIVSEKQSFNKIPIFIELKVSEDRDNPLIKNLQIRTIDNEKNSNFKNVTYFLKIFKNEDIIFSDYFFVEDEIFDLDVMTKNSNMVNVVGQRQYDHNAVIVSEDDQVRIIGPILLNNEKYLFSFDIITLENTDEWIFTLNNFELPVEITGESNFENITENDNSYQEIFKYEYDNLQLIHLEEVTELSDRLRGYAIDWKTGKINDEEFLNIVQKEDNKLFNSITFESNDIPNSIHNNAGRIAGLILTGFEPSKMNFQYIYDEIFPCNEEFVGNPNYDCWDIQINSAGFRNPEIVKQKTDGVFRIIAVGGSTTFAGETYEDTWAGHLQKIIDKEISEIEVEVINAGESGATTKNELQLIKTKLIEFEPDLIIMYDGWNDSANIPVEETIQNWQNICEFGNENGFSTSIFIQPLPASGDRINSYQEINSVHNVMSSSPKNYQQISQNYINSINRLENNCSQVVDLRWIFDYITTPIFYDGGHILGFGNHIIAANIFSYISPEVFGKNYVIEYNTQYLKEPGNEIFQLYAAGIDMKNLKSHGLELNDSIFDKANLSNSDFKNSNFSNSRFVFSDLSKINLSGADLTNANLSGALIDFNWIYCKTISDFITDSPEFPLKRTMTNLLKLDC